MELPGIFQSIIGLLLALAPVAALASFILAGLQLRAEGGVNYDAGGSFFKWLFWGAVFLTLPSINIWLANHNVVVKTYSNPYMPLYASQLKLILENFMNDVVVDRIVPVLAAALVVKAVLDTAEGHSPLPSTIAALFLLGVQGVFSMAKSWASAGDEFGTATVLQHMVSYLATTICPLIGALCVSAAILSYVRNRPWGHLVGSGVAFLCVPGLWALIKTMAGVSVSW